MDLDKEHRTQSHLHFCWIKKNWMFTGIAAASPTEEVGFAFPDTYGSATAFLNP